MSKSYHRDDERRVTQAARRAVRKARESGEQPVFFIDAATAQAVHTELRRQPRRVR